MIRISLKCFYVFSVLVFSVLFSYAQNVALADIATMTDEEFERYLATLPRFTPEQMEELEELGRGGQQGNRFRDAVPAGKRKNPRHPISNTSNRQS